MIEFSDKLAKNVIAQSGEYFVKRPLVIRAVRIEEDDFSIETLEGVMRGKKGDWLIRGIKGEFYPCAHDIFLACYDEHKFGE